MCTRQLFERKPVFALSNFRVREMSNEWFLPKRPTARGQSQLQSVRYVGLSRCSVCILYQSNVGLCVQKRIILMLFFFVKRECVLFVVIPALLSFS